MAQVINLNRARKRKLRADKATEATARAVRHGMSKARRAAEEAAAEAADRKLDQHRRDPPTPVERPQDD